MMRSPLRVSLLPARLVVASAVLVAFGNWMAWLVGTATPVGPWPGAIMGVVLSVAALFWAFCVADLSRSDLGLSGPPLLKSAAIGLLVAIGIGLLALFFLRFPPLVGGPVEYNPLADMSPVALLMRIMVWMPLDTVMPEEIAFRGVLLAELRRRTSALGATLVSAALFVVWHVVVVSRTLAVTNLRDRPLLLSVGLVLAFAAVLVGGVLFAALRIRTGHLAASVVAHWGFNSLLLVGLAVR